MNQAQQLTGASELYKAELGVYPASLQDLVDQAYLKSIPVALLSTDATGVGSAMADPGTWTMVTPSVAVFALAPVTLDVCVSLNNMAYSVDSVLQSARSTLPIQCYGSSTGALQVIAARSSEQLVLASEAATPSVAIGTVLTAPIPDPCATDATAAGWTTGALSAQCAATTPAASLAGQSVIDLGADGQLTNPVQVGGNWYYYWKSREHDHSGGLDALFNHDINGVTNTTVANVDGQYGTTDTYRYATINDVRLALPTSSNLTSICGSVGVPSGWNPDTYWTATPLTPGHAVVGLDVCWGYSVDDNNTQFVALQVL